MIKFNKKMIEIFILITFFYDAENYTLHFFQKKKAENA